MRVKREQIAAAAGPETSLRPAIKALRVPTSAHTIVVSPEPLITTTAQIEETPAPILQEPMIVKKRVTVPEFVKSPRAEKIPELPTLFSEVESSDWAVRNHVFELLLRSVNAKDFKMNPKVYDLVSLGLDDPHFRTNQSAVSVVWALLEQNISIEPLFVKTVGVVYHAEGQKARQSWFDQSERLLRDCLLSLNDHAPYAIMQALGDNSILRKGKTKAGLIVMLHAILGQHLEAYVSKPTSKSDGDLMAHDM